MLREVTNRSTVSGAKPQLRLSPKRESLPASEEYLFHLIDEKQHGAVTSEDIVAFLDALKLLPTASDGRTLDREGIILMLDQVVSYYCTRRLVEDGSSTTAFMAPDDILLSINKLDKPSFVEFVREALPLSTSVALQRLREAEEEAKLEANCADLAQQRQAIAQEIASDIGSIERYGLLIQQCHRALNERQTTVSPLVHALEGKQCQLTKLLNELQELHLHAETLRDEKEAAERLVAFRHEEYMSWEARMTEWRGESARLSEEIESVDVEERVLEKRLSELRARKQELSGMRVDVEAHIAECEGSLQAAMNTLQDARIIDGDATTQLLTAQRRFHDHEAKCAAMQKALATASVELQRDDSDTQAILRRIGVLKNEVDALQIRIQDNDVRSEQLGMLQAELEARCQENRMTSTEGRNRCHREQRISVLTDELRLANERRRIHDRARRYRSEEAAEVSRQPSQAEVSRQPSQAIHSGFSSREVSLK